MTDLQNVGSDLRIMWRRMLVDPTKVYVGNEVLRQAVVGLHPKVLVKLLKWQHRVRPNDDNFRLYDRCIRLIDGRDMRRATLPRTQRVRTIDFGDGIKLRFTDDHPAAGVFMRRVLPVGRVHEPELVNYLKKTVRRGDLIVDIGAHAGYVSCIAAALGATVIAAELQPTLIPIIQLNAALNDLWTVHTLCAALGDRAGFVPTMRVGPSPGFQASVGQWDRADYPLSSLNHDCIPCMTLDSLFPSGPVPSLIKIDVEGAEGLVLKGAHGLIAAGTTRFMVEVHGHLIGGFGTTLADILAPFPADRWSLSMLTEDGVEPLPRKDFLDPAGPIATHKHNAPVLFEPASH
ncbi:FkbM family methyltransferase [Thalassobaculum sp.]|uniref:FkbM family methyltransferase n=1 Tax=Thalassobaculum sp. TaxID=2022740 RepID=UPI0032EC78C2